MNVRYTLPFSRRRSRRLAGGIALTVDFGGGTLDLAAVRHEGTRFAHVPGRGGGEANAALLGGHVMVSVESPGWAPLVESGELRLLADSFRRHELSLHDALEPEHPPILRELKVSHPQLEINLKSVLTATTLEMLKANTLGREERPHSVRRPALNDPR